MVQLKKFNNNIANMVWSLTNNKEELMKIWKTKYLLEKMNNILDDVLPIKLANRLDNVSDLSNDNQK